MTAATVEISTLIETTPGVNGGKPFVSGAGVSVHQVSILFNEGATPGEIVERYEGLTLAGVYAALAHYFANREQIEAELAAELALYEKLRAAHPGGWRRGR
jgi:uncharacterized protein (DUF433 family)